MTQTSELPELTTRQKLLGKARRQYRYAEIPDVGPVRIRNLTAREQIAVANTIPDNATNLEAMVAYVMACCVNEDDSPLFEEADRPQLLELDAGAMARLSVVIRELCGLDVGVQDQAKNSSTSRSDCSPSGSPKPADD